MVTLNEGIRAIAEMANEKGWGNDIATKIYYGMIELAEAGDAWKHRDDEKYLLEELGITKDQLPEYIAEELIDCILYCFHGFHCIGFYDADYMYEYKMKKNQNRNRIYTDDVNEGLTLKDLEPSLNDLRAGRESPYIPLTALETKKRID